MPKQLTFFKQHLEHRHIKAVILTTQNGIRVGYRTQYIDQVRWGQLPDVHGQFQTTAKAQAKKISGLYGGHIQLLVSQEDFAVLPRCKKAIYTTQEPDFYNDGKTTSRIELEPGYYNFTTLKNRGVAIVRIDSHRGTLEYCVSQVLTLTLTHPHLRTLDVLELDGGHKITGKIYCHNATFHNSTGSIKVGNEIKLKCAVYDSLQLEYCGVKRVRFEDSDGIANYDLIQVDFVDLSDTRADELILKANPSRRMFGMVTCYDTPIQTEDTSTLLKKEMTRAALGQLGVLTVDVTYDQKTHAVRLDDIHHIVWNDEDNAKGTIFLHKEPDHELHNTLTGLVRLRVSADTLKTLNQEQVIHTDKIAQGLKDTSPVTSCYPPKKDTTLTTKAQLLASRVKEVTITTHGEDRTVVPVEDINFINWINTEIYDGEVVVEATCHQKYRGIRRYGLLSVGYVPLVKTAPAVTVTNVVNVTDPAEIAEAVNTPEGEKVIVDYLRKIQPHVVPSRFKIHKAKPSFIADVADMIKDRQADYASPADNHGLTTTLVDAWLAARRTQCPTVDRLTPEDVCMINILQKISRLANGTHADSYKDIIGYAENVAQLNPEQRNNK